MSPIKPVSSFLIYILSELALRSLRTPLGFPSFYDAGATLVLR